MEPPPSSKALVESGASALDVVASLTPQQFNNDEIQTVLQYLSTPACLEELVVNMLSPLPPREASHYNDMYMLQRRVTEIVGNEISTNIQEGIAGDPRLLGLLFSGLYDSEADLKSLQTTYMSHVACTMLSMFSEDLLAFFQRKSIHLVDCIVSHLRVNAVVDLLLKLVSVEAPDTRGGILDYLKAGSLVPKLLALLRPENGDAAMAAAACLAIMDIITVTENTAGSAVRERGGGGDGGYVVTFRLASQSPLMTQLLDRSTSDQLARDALASARSKTTSGLPMSNPWYEQSLTVLVELLSHVAGGVSVDSDAESRPILVDGEVPPFVAGVLTLLPQFMELLSPSSSSYPMETTYGTLDPPLGSTRLKIVEVLASLTHLRYRGVMDAIASHRVIPTAIELFFQYEWNNFLHTLVVDIVECALECPHREVRAALLDEDAANIFPKVMSVSMDESDMTNKTRPFFRKGYMGQVTQICNMLYVARSNVAQVDEAARRCEGWDNFVTGLLAAINTIQATRTFAQPLEAAVSEADGLVANATSAVCEVAAAAAFNDV